MQESEYTSITTCIGMITRRRLMSSDSHYAVIFLMW